MTVWMTLSEAAAYVRVSEYTMREWCRAGRVPSHRCPGSSRRRVDRDELDAVMRNGGKVVPIRRRRMHG